MGTFYLAENGSRQPMIEQPLTLTSSSGLWTGDAPQARGLREPPRFPREYGQAVDWRNGPRGARDREAGGRQGTRHESTAAQIDPFHHRRELDFNLAHAPLQFFGDVAANTYIVPQTAIDLGAALGLRVYF
jgi:hypothetical protein